MPKQNPELWCPTTDLCCVSERHGKQAVIEPSWLYSVVTRQNFEEGIVSFKSNSELETVSWLTLLQLMTRLNRKQNDQKSNIITQNLLQEAAACYIPAD